MVDPGEDFGGFMEQLAAEQAHADERQRLYDEHEHWRTHTWGGFIVRTLQAIAAHFKPFMLSVSSMMDDDENIGKRVLFFVLRLTILFAMILFIYTLGRLFNYIVGGDIIQEEEVVVVHEHETPEEAERARKAALASRGKRQKKED